MTVQGATQGSIAGCSSAASTQGQIPLELLRQDDSRIALSAASGSNAFAPLIAVTQICTQSPLLLKALDAQEDVTVTINWWRVNPNGTETVFYRVTLTNARIVSIRHFHTGMREREEVSFAYADLTETYLPASDSAQIFAP